MSLISVELLKPGMVLEQTVYTPNSSNCLLTSGTALSIRNIQKLKDLGFTEVEVADPYTLFVSPNDNMAQLVVEDFIRVLRNTSPKRPEANKNDYIVTVAKQLETLIHKLVASDEVLSFLVQLRIINKRRIFKI